MASGKWQLATANDKGNVKVKDKGKDKGKDTVRRLPFAVAFDVRHLPVASCQLPVAISPLFCFGCCSCGSQAGGKSVE